MRMGWRWRLGWGELRVGRAVVVVVTVVVDLATRDFPQLELVEVWWWEGRSMSISTSMSEEEE